PGGGGINSTNGLVMSYFDGNTVTALWNYAQNFVLSDNSYGSTFGPSTVGLMKLMAGQTNGVVAYLNGTGSFVPDGKSGCARSTKSNITGETEEDYIPHHSLTSYWPSIANLTHARPCGEAYGTAGCANHNYDVLDFYTAVSTGQQPAVSFIKAQAYQDAHPGYSDPIDEQ